MQTTFGPSSSITQRSPAFRRGLRVPSIVGFCLAATLGMNSGSCDVTPPNGGNGNCNPNQGAPVLLAADHILGDASAPLTVFVYSDMECPFCGRFERESFATIKAQFIDTGKIRWVFRHFPLRNIHARAEQCARASECASDQGNFWGFIARVFANQSDLSDAALTAHAAALGMDTTAFNACAGSSQKAVRVQQDVNSGTSLGVTGTPTFFVGSEKVTGFQTAAELASVINRKLCQ